MAGLVAFLLLAPGLAACGDASTPDAKPPALGAPGERADTPSSAIPLPAVAVTVDDLPWVGPLPPGLTRLQATDSILAALAAHGARATGFVNCGRVQPGAPVLRRWLEAGHGLGNHTAGHLDLNVVDPREWAEDARSCDTFLRELTGAAQVPFRYPYLRRGHTAERYRAGRDVVAALGSPIAPVTIETLDWILADAYVAALRAGDSARADVIVEAYLAHALRAARHYRQVAQDRVGRDVAHVLLLHANALLAHHLHTMLGHLADDGFRFISLEAALRDPVYDLDDDYLGREGISWLYRIPPAAPGLAEWDLAEATRLRALRR